MAPRKTNSVVPAPKAPPLVPPPAQADAAATSFVSLEESVWEATYRPPLAVVRRAAGAWPQRVSLSDADAMLPGVSLASGGAVKVIARVSGSGQAVAGVTQISAAALSTRVIPAGIAGALAAALAFTVMHRRASGSTDEAHDISSNFNDGSIDCSTATNRCGADGNGHGYLGGSALVDVMGFGRGDSLLAVVPMFHANAWGLPYSVPMVGA